MSTRSLERTSATKGAWVIIILFFAWLVFVLVPARRPDPTVAAAPEPLLPSKLHEVGLADNVDWEGLPELFAVWCDESRWVDNRVGFAYWNPGTNDYSYFFEATRSGGRTTFREIPKPKDYAELISETLFYDDQPASRDYPIRFIPSELNEFKYTMVPPILLPSLRPTRSRTFPKNLRIPVDVSPVKVVPAPIYHPIVEDRGGDAPKLPPSKDPKSKK